MNLYSDGILVLASKRLDFKMLFEPFDKEFHLPAVAVEQGDIFGGKVEVVGIVYKGTANVYGEINDPSEFGRVIPTIYVTGESDCLVTQDIAFSIDRLISVDNNKFRVHLLADSEESPTKMYGEKSGEVEVSTVKYVYSIGLVPDTVHGFGVMVVGISDAVEYWYLCCDVNLGMGFDAGLCTAETCSTEDGYAKFNCSGIDSIEASLKFKLLGDSTLLGKRYHIECKILEYLRFAEHIGFRESVPDKGYYSNYEIERPFSRNCCYICKFPEASAAHELAEHEHKLMAPIGETPSLGSVCGLLDNSTELPLWQVHCDEAKT